MITNYYSLDILSEIVSNLKENKSRVVFVHGIFDILHEGHLTMLYQAKKLGDYLIIGLDSDKIATRVKGKDRPIRTFDTRCLILSQMKHVDAIFKVDCADKEDLDTLYETIYTRLQPNIIATNISAGEHGLIKQNRAERFNIQFVDIKTQYTNVTTTNLVTRLRNDMVN